MASLSTVYLISVILTSLAGFGSTYMGNKFQGGAVTVPQESEVSLPEEPIVPAVQEIPPVSSTEQTEPPVSSELS